MEYKLKGEYIYMLKFKQYELNCLKILFKCLKGLNFLDKSGLCHRDLSANNIMVIEDDIWQVKIIDLGSAKQLNNNQNKNFGL